MKISPNRPLGKQSETLASPNTETWPQTEKGGEFKENNGFDCPTWHFDQPGNL